MYYFKNEMQSIGGNPTKSRPIDISGFVLSAVSHEPPYALLISPKDSEDVRRHWEFRCDTLQEMEMWSIAFSENSDGFKAHVDSSAASPIWGDDDDDDDSDSSEGN